MPVCSVDVPGAGRSCVRLDKRTHPEELCCPRDNPTKINIAETGMAIHKARDKKFRLITVAMKGTIISQPVERRRVRRARSDLTQCMLNW